MELDEAVPCLFILLLIIAVVALFKPLALEMPRGKQVSSIRLECDEYCHWVKPDITNIELEYDMPESH